MVPVWALSIRKLRTGFEKTRLPLLGIGAAFSFLIMMFNIPLPGGTTGHAVGACLVAVLLGPWAACISVSVALLIQALLFGDGGILAFGANCFNMAFVLPFFGFYAYRVLGAGARTARGGLIGLGLASYLALNLAALCAAIEFGLQPLVARGVGGAPLYCPYPLAISIPAMVLPHLLVLGFVEAFFTAGIFAFIRKAAPGLIVRDRPPGGRAIQGLILGLIGLSPLGLLATGKAWGEWSPEELRSVVTGGKALSSLPAGMEGGWSFGSLFPGYEVSGLPPWLGYLLSALAGVSLLVIVFKLLGAAKGGSGGAGPEAPS
jgi:cobalt/nickel transport system permease protein